jgi:hypothetical protein
MRILRVLPTVATVVLLGSAQASPAHALGREQLEAQLRDYQQQQARIQQEFTSYAFAHVPATACAVATVGGPAMIFTQELDPGLQNALAGVSVLCGAYCLLADPNGCLEAAQTLISAAMRHDQIEKKAASARQQLQVTS